MTLLVITLLRPAQRCKKNVMDIANQMILFAKVVEAEGFSAAARELGLTPSAVSRQIGHLEDRLGTRLLNRSTRLVSLTEVGHAFYKRCAEVARGVEDAEAMVLSLVDHPQGRLRVASTVAFAKSQIMPLMPAFIAQNPDVELSFELTDRMVDMVEERIDMAIRFTEQLNDPSAVARKLAPNKRVFVAAPSYLAENGKLEKPQDLTQHNCLQLSTVKAFNLWQLENGHEHQEILIDGNFDANTADGVYYAALAGMGVAKLSTYLVNDAIADGRLIQVLPDYWDESSDILAVYSDRHNLSPNVRALVDFLVARFAGTPPWEREAA